MRSSKGATERMDLMAVDFALLVSNWGYAEEGRDYHFGDLLILLRGVLSMRLEMD